MNIERAARVISEADAIVVGAGAGMGVDSGLPDFRGDEGFWNAYPPFKTQNLSFIDLANPIWFEHDASLAWGFYGHRLNLYRDTKPHRGFELLYNWINRAPLGGFVFTSNVDGQFQSAGFSENQIVECHGSIHYLQCLAGCDRQIFPADVSIDVSPDFRAGDPLPFCQVCDRIMRPNILMFSDFAWLTHRTDLQFDRFSAFASELKEAKVAVIELGAGRAIPTVRLQCERLAESPNATLIRINPREPYGPKSSIELAMGARDALSQIAEALDS